MNKKEIKKEIEELKNKIIELENEIKAKPLIRKRPRAAKGKCCFFIGSYGNISRFFDDYTYVDNYRYNIGNYYPTKEDAEKAQEKQLIRQELEDLALEINIEPEDWENNNQRKYSISYDHDHVNNKLVQTSTYNFQDIGLTYCTNKDFLETALEKIGKEKLLKLVGVKE